MREVPRAASQAPGRRFSSAAGSCGRCPANGPLRSLPKLCRPAGQPPSRARISPTRAAPCWAAVLNPHTGYVTGLSSPAMRRSGAGGWRDRRAGLRCPGSPGPCSTRAPPPKCPRRPARSRARPHLRDEGQQMRCYRPPKRLLRSLVPVPGSPPRAGGAPHLPTSPGKQLSAARGSMRLPCRAPPPRRPATHGAGTCAGTGRRRRAAGRDQPVRSPRRPEVAACREL